MARHAGAVISITFLFALGGLNLAAVIRTPRGQMVVPVGLRGRWFAALTRASRPWLVAGVGALFALSFDTLSQATLFAIAGAQLGGGHYPLLLALMLGARHGFDADHLATVDALTRFNAAANARFARWCGALFSLGDAPKSIVLNVFQLIRSRPSSSLQWKVRSGMGASAAIVRTACEYAAPSPQVVASLQVANTSYYERSHSLLYGAPVQRIGEARYLRSSSGCSPYGFIPGPQIRDEREHCLFHSPKADGFASDILRKCAFIPQTGL